MKFGLFLLAVAVVLGMAVGAPSRRDMDDREMEVIRLLLQRALEVKGGDAPLAAPDADASDELDDLPPPPASTDVEDAPSDARPETLPETPANDQDEAPERPADSGHAPETPEEAPEVPERPEDDEDVDEAPEVPEDNDDAEEAPERPEDDEDEDEDEAPEVPEDDDDEDEAPEAPERPEDDEDEDDAPEVPEDDDDAEVEPTEAAEVESDDAEPSDDEDDEDDEDEPEEIDIEDAGQEEEEENVPEEPEAEVSEPEAEEDESSGDVTTPETDEFEEFLANLFSSPLLKAAPLNGEDLTQLYDNLVRNLGTVRMQLTSASHVFIDSTDPDQSVATARIIVNGGVYFAEAAVNDLSIFIGRLFLYGLDFDVKCVPGSPEAKECIKQKMEEIQDFFNNMYKHLPVEVTAVTCSSFLSTETEDAEEQADLYNADLNCMLEKRLASVKGFVNEMDSLASLVRTEDAAFDVPKSDSVDEALNEVLSAEERIIVRALGEFFYTLQALSWEMNAVGQN